MLVNYKNLKFNYLIDDINIDIWFYGNFTSIEDIRRKYNPIVNLSKFTLYIIYIYIYIYIDWSCNY